MRNLCKDCIYSLPSGLHHCTSCSDCVSFQLIRSKEAWKQVAIRFLQVNIFNDTVYRNAIELYNGEFFDYRQSIVTLTANSSLGEIRRRYWTTPPYDTMGIRVTASPAFEDYGFIAEVVTIPLSPGWRQDYGLLYCLLTYFFLL